MKLQFIGMDGSMGLRTGEVYDIRISIDEKYIWVEWKVACYGPFATKRCPYVSVQLFAQNWELPRYYSKYEEVNYGTKKN